MLQEAVRVKAYDQGDTGGRRGRCAKSVYFECMGYLGSPNSLRPGVSCEFRLAGSKKPSQHVEVARPRRTAAAVVTRCQGSTVGIFFCKLRGARSPAKEVKVHPRINYGETPDSTNRRELRQEVRFSRLQPSIQADGGTSPPQHFKRSCSADKPMWMIQ